MILFKREKKINRKILKTLERRISKEYLKTFKGTFPLKRQGILKKLPKISKILRHSSKYFLL